MEPRIPAFIKGAKTVHELAEDEEVLSVQIAKVGNVGRTYLKVRFPPNQNVPKR
jgi:hypothetical protein